MVVAWERGHGDRLTHNPTSCHEHMAPDNEGLRTVVANLTFVQLEPPYEFENKVKGREDVWLADIALCVAPFEKGENEQSRSRDNIDFQGSSAGILDQLFGGKGNGQLFLEQRFQQGPMFAQGFAGKLVENLSLDKMLEDYRHQNQMHLVRIDKCKIAERPPLVNATIALGLLSDSNCTIRLAFEQLSDVHVLADMQSKIESELSCPVTAHVYVSPRDIQALDIHTDPYDVFVTQIQGSKIWKMYLPLPQANLAKTQKTL